MSAVNGVHRRVTRAVEVSDVIDMTVTLALRYLTYEMAGAVRRAVADIEVGGGLEDSVHVLYTQFHQLVRVRGYFNRPQTAMADAIARMVELYDRAVYEGERAAADECVRYTGRWLDRLEGAPGRGGSPMAEVTDGE
jgi:hypothetical protein